MKHRGQIKGDVDDQAVAEKVYLATDAARLMKEAGLTPPTATSKTFSIMGKAFDPAKSEEYLNSFAIRRVGRTAKCHPPAQGRHRRPGFFLAVLLLAWQIAVGEGAKTEAMHREYTALMAAAMQ